MNLIDLQFLRFYTKSGRSSHCFFQSPTIDGTRWDILYEKREKTGIEVIGIHTVYVACTQKPSHSK